MSPRHRNREVIVLVLNRNKAEIVLTSHRFDGQAPVGAPKRYRRGNSGATMLDETPRGVAKMHTRADAPPISHVVDVRRRIHATRDRTPDKLSIGRKIVQLEAYAKYPTGTALSKTPKQENGRTEFLVKALQGCIFGPHIFLVWLHRISQNRHKP